jgi:hypothetical protein
VKYVHKLCAQISLLFVRIFLLHIDSYLEARASAA